MRTLRPQPLYTPSRTIWRRHYHITDVHLGHAACHEAMLRADIERIAADPFATWGGGGDLIDAINHKDPRFSLSSIAPWARERQDILDTQIRRLVELLTPIAGKCIYMLTGNHEEAVHQHIGIDVHHRIASAIAGAKGCDVSEIALRWEGFIVLTFRRGTPESYGGTRSLVMYAHHGAGGGRKKGGDALRAEEVMGRYDADVYLLGHRHKRDVYTLQVIRPHGRGVSYHERLCIWGGGYLNGVLDDKGDVPAPHYPASKQLFPITPGIVPLLIKPDVPRVMPVVSNGAAGELMDAIINGNGFQEAAR